jgi:purine-binding chemotaxis protein CheW
MAPSNSQIRPAHTIVLVVRLGRELYALPIEAVEEVLPALLIDSVPQCPEYVRGVVFVRGELVPVVDAAQRLGMNGRERPDEPPIVCIRLGDRLVGVEFDEAIDLMEIRLDRALPEDGVSAAEGLLSGLVEHEGRLIRVLDPERLIATDDARRFDKLGQTA